MSRLLLITCVALQAFFASAKVIPDRFPKSCRKSDPNYNDCLLKYLNAVSPELIKGVPELNIPSFSPYHVPVYAINRTINEFLSVSAIMKDIKVWGYEKMELKSFRFNPEKLVGDFEAFFPVMRVTMKYDATGQLFSPTPMKDSGSFKGQATDVFVSAKFRFTTVENSGVKYLKLDEVHSKVHIGNAHIKMISNNKENSGVADFITNFFNENPRRVVDDVMPIVQEATEPFIKAVTDTFIGSIPIDEVIPE